MRIRLRLALLFLIVLAVGVVRLVYDHYYPPECRDFLRKYQAMKERIAARTWEREPIRGEGVPGNAWQERKAAAADLSTRRERSYADVAHLREVLLSAGLRRAVPPTDPYASEGRALIGTMRSEPTLAPEHRVDVLLESLQTAMDTIGTAWIRDPEWGYSYNGIVEAAPLMIETLHELDAAIRGGDVRSQHAKLETALERADLRYPSMVPAREAAIAHRLDAPRFFIDPIPAMPVSSGERRRAVDIGMARGWQLLEAEALAAGEAAASLEAARDAIRRTRVLTQDEIIGDITYWRQFRVRIRELRALLRPELAASLIDPITGRALSTTTSVGPGQRPQLPVVIPWHASRIAFDPERWRVAMFTDTDVHVFNLSRSGSLQICSIPLLSSASGPHWYWQEAGLGTFHGPTGALVLRRGTWNVDHNRLMREPERPASTSSPEDYAVYSPNRRFAVTHSDARGSYGWVRESTRDVTVLDVDSTPAKMHAKLSPPIHYSVVDISPNGWRLLFKYYTRWEWEGGEECFVMDARNQAARAFDLGDGERVIRRRWIDDDIEIVTSQGRFLYFNKPDTSMDIAWADKILAYIPELDAAVITNWADKQTRIVPWPK